MYSGTPFGNNYASADNNAFPDRRDNTTPGNNNAL
jgi:hypothetical protein